MNDETNNEMNKESKKEYNDYDNILAKEMEAYRDLPVEAVWEDYIEINDAIVHGIKTPDSEESEKIFSLIREAKIIYHVLKLRPYSEKRSLLELLNECVKDSEDDMKEGFLCDLDYFKHEFLQKKKK